MLPRWSRIAIPHLTVCEGETIEALRRALMRAGQPDEFRSIREYAPGDDPRRVNWKATARRDTPLVNDYESSSEVVTTVVLDTSIDDHDPDGFERAVSVATSFVLCSDAETPHPPSRLRLVIGDSPVVEIDSSNRDDVTRQLALVSPSSASSADVLPVQAGRLNVAVIATGSSDTSRIESFRRGLGRVDALIVVSCAREALRLDSRSTVHVPDFDDFAAQWHRLVRRRRLEFA